MPPKRRPEQYEKNTTNNIRNSRNASRPTRVKPLATSSHGSETNNSRTIPPWRLSKNVSAPEYKTKIESLWKQMGNSRVVERQNAIKKGLIADPNKRTTLANAIRVVGTSQDMCPEFERIQRIRENAVDKAEKVTIHNGVKVADELRMVKAFHRPDAGKEEQLPSDLRPPAVLQRTVRYLFDKVASPSASLAEHHKFVWDRTRCIRNDFTIQASGRLDDIKIAIQCYEDIARFHILSLHQMPKIGKHDYDAQQELEQLSATLLSLFEFYDDNRNKYEAPREAEFRAYKLLIDIRSRTNDTFERVQTWPSRVRDSFHVQTAVQLCQASGQLFTDSGSMLSPYSRAMRVEQASYEKFWSILESPKVDYLMACAAAVSFNEIRARALETMAKVYRSGPQSRMQDISLEELTFALGLDSKSQTRRLLRETGLHVSKHANGVSYLDLDELSGPLPKNAIASADQIFSRSIVEVKREDRVFSAIYSGFEVSYCKDNGLIDESESDADFEPDAADLDSDDEQHESLFVDEDKDEDKDEEAKVEAPAKTTTTKIVNPFSSFGSREVTPQPTTSLHGDFGLPSGAQLVSDVAAKPPNPFASSNPFTKPATFINPFSQASQPSVVPSGSGMFGPVSTVFDKPKDASEAIASSGAEPGAPGANTIPTSASKTGLFQWTPPTSSTSSQQETSDSSKVFFPSLKQNDMAAESLQLSKTTSTKQPLFPFTFPSTTNTQTTATSTEISQTFQPPKPIFDSILPATSSSLFSLPPSVQAAPSLFASGESCSQSGLGSMQSGQAATSSGLKADNATITAPLTSNSSESPPTTSMPVVAPVAAQPREFEGIKSSAEKAVTNIKPSTLTPPTRPIITQKQKDDILNMIAKDVVLSQNGILEQFIEAHLGPIYDRAERKVMKEFEQAKLEEIKQSILGCKYLYIWKRRVDEKVRRKKAQERRQRMRQSQRQEFSKESSVSDVGSPIQEAPTSTRSNGQLKYLTRGFQETFDKSVSSPRSLPMQKRPGSVLTEDRLSIPSMSGTLVKTTSSAHHADKRSRHSRSQTVDGTTRASSSALSSASMPPPNAFLKPRSTARSRAFELKPFVGTGFLQNEALRREAIDFARRSGSTTTTSSDYFRLKARNIDPDTKVIPSTRKRGRESGDNFVDNLLSKTRRLSESTVSTISVSESTRELLARSSLSESARLLLNGQRHGDDIATSGTATPRYTDDEDALFEAARKLRETLADDTNWMRSMREEQEKDENTLSAETPAQRRLREFKATPSKTSTRLRQTHANGLLPPDYFEKHNAAEHNLLGAETTANPSGRDTGLAALPNNRHQLADDFKKSKAPSKSGQSFEDAIEL